MVGIIFPNSLSAVKDVGMSRIVAVKHISYVEAVKRVEGARGHNSEEDMAVDAPQPVANGIPQSSYLDTFSVKKVDFVAFIASVINRTAQMSKKPEQLDIIIAAAKKFLGLQDFPAEALQGLLSPENVPPSQDPSEPVYGLDYNRKASRFILYGIVIYLFDLYPALFPFWDLYYPLVQ